jgi:Tol biopolymer transport system component
VRAVVFFTSFFTVSLVATAAAFASFAGGNGSLLISLSPADVDRPALYALDGRGHPRLLAPDVSSQYGSGVYSPAGTTIAFSRVNAAKQTLGVWLMDATGGHRRVIIADLGSPAFAWSPDGKHLAVFLQGPGELALVDLHGKQRAILGRRIHAESMDWAPNGRTIYFEGWETGSVPVSCRPGICALDVRSEKLRQVIVDDQRRTSWAHYWVTTSPDSKRIAFVRNCFSGDCRQLRNTDGLVVANANGSGARVLVRGAAVGWPVWSPDGSSIAYVEQYTGAGPPANTVQLVSTSTGAVRPLKAFPAEPGAQSPPPVGLLSWQSR